jgi:hypothetical protein
MKITIEGNVIRAVSPEGQTAQMTLRDFLRAMAPHRMSTCGVVLPHGIKLVYSRGPITIWIHETPPCIFNFRWMANDSPLRLGRKTKSRQVRIGLPYLIVMAVFAPGENGRQQLSAANECFFLNEPITTEDQELLYPALLNCSRFVPPDGHPLSWICTQYLDRSPFIALEDTNQRLRAGFVELMRCLLQSGFNASSDLHEHSSWYTESTRVDPRIATIEKWEEATKADPFFVQSVPWLKTGLSIRQVAERTFQNLLSGPSGLPGRDGTGPSAGDLARVIFNSKAPSQS